MFCLCVALACHDCSRHSSWVIVLIVHVCVCVSRDDRVCQGTQEKIAPSREQGKIAWMMMMMILLSCY